jgi:hypothetical protein
MKEAARDGDSKVAKKAKLLAEAAATQKNSILRHMQTGAKDTGLLRGGRVQKEAACKLRPLSSLSSSQSSPS